MKKEIIINTAHSASESAVAGGAMDLSLDHSVIEYSELLQG